MAGKKTEKKSRKRVSEWATNYSREKIRYLCSGRSGMKTNSDIKFLTFVGMGAVLGMNFFWNRNFGGYQLGGF